MAEVLSVGQFAERVALLCMFYRGSVTSWGRTPSRQKAVGEDRFSWHNLFLGADVVMDASANEGSFKALAERMGLQVIVEGDHLHVEVAI